MSGIKRGFKYHSIAGSIPASTTNYKQLIIKTMKLLQLCLAIFLFVGSLFFVYSAANGNPVFRMPFLVLSSLVAVLCYINARISYKEYKNNQIV